MTPGVIVISITFCICNIVFYCILGKDNFRFNLLITACLISMLFAVGKTIELGGISDNRVSFIVLFIINIFPFTLYKNRYLIYYAVYYCWNSIYNCIGALFLGILYPLISSALTNNVEWYVRSEGPAGMVIVECLCMVFASIVSWLIARKLKPVMLELKGIPEKLIIILLPIQSVFVLLIKNLFVNLLTYSDDPQGIGFIFDAISFICFTTGLVILVFVTIRKMRTERHIEALKLQDQSDYFQKEAEELQEEYREWRHDQRNLQLSNTNLEENE